MPERLDPLSLDRTAPLGAAVRDVLRARLFVRSCHHNLQEQAYRQWDNLLVRLSDSEFRQYMDALDRLGLRDMRREPLSQRADLETDRARLHALVQAAAALVPQRNPGQEPRG